MQSAAPSRHPKYRTKLCRNFASGDCPFGQKCSFIHPAPGTNPCASLAQYLFSWNALLLPQLLALSNQQKTLKEMPRRSPPRPQAPQLVDEDLSPTTSLLLSKSDSTSSEQVPQTRRTSRRKKTPCRHFLRTGGWCPAAGKCRFYHDVAALSSADVQKAERAPPFAADAHGEGGRSTSGGSVLMGIQSPSPPTVGQTHPEPCRYTEAEQTQPYQPMYWPNCSWQPYQPYYATVAPTAAVPVRAGAAPSSLAQQGVYPPPQHRVQTVPPCTAQSHLPLGSYEVNGTTYFQTSMASVPAPPPVPYQIPAHPLSYNHAMAPVYASYYVPPTLPAGYYDNTNQSSGPQTTFDPFGSDPMKPSELPVISRLEDYQMSPVQQGVFLPLLSPSLVANGDLGVKNEADEPTVTQEHEFPYRPPKDQRVGHARRISVNIKKRVRVNSG